MFGNKDLGRPEELGRGTEPFRQGAGRGRNPEARLSRWAAALDGRLPASLEAGGVRPVLQKKAMAGDTANDAQVETPEAQPAVAPALLLDDEVEGPLAAGQMRKSEFLAQLRAAVCATAEEALANTIWSADGCPWIERWFAYYAGRDAAQVEAAAHKYAPESRGVADAASLIPLLAERVRAGIAAWSAGGGVSGVPRDLPQLPGGAEEGVEAGVPLAQKAQGDGAGLARAHPAGLQRELGPGQPLDAGVRSQMEGALGADLGGVRVHTNAGAASLAGRLRARAFTVGPHVSFGAGEYQPGTPVGDALLAHELAHTVQQRGGQVSGSTQSTLESAADEAATGAVMAQWAGLGGQLTEAARRGITSLRTGLSLQRCDLFDSKPKQKEAEKLKPAGRPEKYPTFEAWLSTFPAFSETGTRDVTETAPDDLRNLVAGKTRVPPDCADVSLLLRHYWLKAKAQSLTFKAGPGKGKDFTIGKGVSDEGIRAIMIDLGSINFQEDRKAFALVKFYRKGGKNITNLKDLVAAGLTTGDVLVWKRAPGVTGNFEGHVQTVQAVEKQALTVLQGNMSAGKGVGELQQRRLTFQDLTGQDDGNADILPRPPGDAEETFLGAGPWRQ